MEDTYLTIASGASLERKERGSRFIAEVFPVAKEAAAEEAIAAVRRRAYSATHHCTAYRLGPAGDFFRYNDDGEPSGTAGLPILRQIEGRGLTDVLVVVTRYYGGTKLGTGGLIRAYGGAAEAALAACPVRTVVLRDEVRVRFAYDDTSPAMHTIDRFDAEIRATRYTEQTELIVAVRRSQTAAFAAAFIDALGARGTAEPV